MAERPANAEMISGYMDGFDLSAPEPSENRSASYRHGFKNGRADKTGKSWGSFNEISRLADLAMEEDEAKYLSPPHEKI